MIYIIGLGASDELNMKDSIKNFLLNYNDKKIIARTEDHPAIKFLDDNSIPYETCDKFYIEQDNFTNVYENIVNYILEVAKENDVYYLVPGHPMVAERTTVLLLESDENVKIVGGESFLDSCFNAAKFDPVEGFSLIDATNLESLKDINPRQHNLITQCYDDLTAGDIALEIADYYPEIHPVTIMEQVGCEDEKIYTCDRIDELQFTVGEEVNNLRTIYIPPFKNSVDYNIKKLTPEFKEEVTNTLLIENIENSLNVIKNSNDDKKTTVELANILKNVLDFQNSEDGYYYIEEILKNIPGNKN